MKHLRFITFGIAVLVLLMCGCSKPEKILVLPDPPAPPAPPPPPKKIFFFDALVPAHAQSENALQESIDYPPFLRPDGKRRTIHPTSQYFTLAVLNAVDISGRSQDLQKSVADMLYTELFEKNRFNLLDRGELVDLNPEWFVSSIKASLDSLNNTIKVDTIRENTIEQKTYKARQPNIIDSTVEFLKMCGNAYEKMYTGLLSKVDGVLLVYITSRKGGANGGKFGVDYRIVNQVQGAIGNVKEIVLFAGTANVRYRCSSRREIEINRNDIKKIASEIVDVFPKPQDIENSQIVKRDQRWIVINQGSDNGIIPGLFGYAAVREDSVFVEDGPKVFNPRHYAYLAKFVVTEVYPKTSTALLLSPPEFDSADQKEGHEWDVRVGDSAVIK